VQAGARTAGSAGRRRALRGGRVALVVATAAALAGGAYAAALETSIFAVDRLDVVGGSTRARSEIRTALAPELGRSLAKIDSAEIERRIAPLPDVIGVTYDRRFPHTLRVRVTAERPVLLLRRGPDTWLVSARGRVLRALAHPKLSSLPRVWIPKGTGVSVGQILPAADGGAAAVALAPIQPHSFASGIRSVSGDGIATLTLVLRSGLQIRLGDAGDLRLKLAIARRVLGAVHADATTTGYVDVSLPERPVISSANSQVSTGA
jgi:cell division protein FtsQ